MRAPKRLILKMGGLAVLCFQGDRVWKMCLLWWVFWEDFVYFRGLDFGEDLTSHTRRLSFLTGLKAR